MQMDRPRLIRIAKPATPGIDWSRKTETTILSGFRFPHPENRYFQTVGNDSAGLQKCGILKANQNRAPLMERDYWSAAWWRTRGPVATVLVQARGTFADQVILLFAIFLYRQRCVQCRSMTVMVAKNSKSTAFYACCRGLNLEQCTRWPGDILVLLMKRLPECCFGDVAEKRNVLKNSAEFKFLWMICLFVFKGGRLRPEPSSLKASTFRYYQNFAFFFAEYKNDWG